MLLFYYLFISCNIFIQRHFLFSNMLLSWGSVHTGQAEKLLLSLFIGCQNNELIPLRSAEAMHECFCCCYIVIICVSIYCSYSCWCSNWSIFGWGWERYIQAISCAVDMIVWVSGSILASLCVIRCSRIILYVSCFTSEMNYFSKKPWFCLVANGIWRTCNLGTRGDCCGWVGHCF